MDTKISSILEFCELKKSILDIIANADTTISKGSCNHESGIYLLYVDNFEDDKIIPVYIGKTVDFQKRFQNHIRDIKALMKYHYAEYHEKFFWSAVGKRRAFEGKYRPCKIFKYIVDHDCLINDVKMIVLERCSEENLDEKEQYYLSKFLPAFFGFNQIATVADQFAYRNDPEKERLTIEKDFVCFQHYMEYGYSAFNYLHAFSRYGSAELNQKVHLLIGNHLWLPQNELLSRTVSAFEKYEKVYQEIYEVIREKFAEQIHNIFNMYRFNSKGRETDVISAFTNHCRTVIVDDINCNLDYLEYYFDRDRKSRECGEMIKDLYDANAAEIDRITKPVKIAFEAYVNSRDFAIKQSEYSIIFPQKLF